MAGSEEMNVIDGLYLLQNVSVGTPSQATAARVQVASVICRISLEGKFCRSHSYGRNPDRQAKSYI